MDRLDPIYLDAIRFLYERINYEKTSDRPYNRQTFRLGRMAFLLHELGNPHLAAPVIHIAGTKGKGSVAWLIAETFRHSGYRTGLYTSPHLKDLEERFVIDAQQPSIDEVYLQIERLRGACSQTEVSEHGPPTFFEMTTALAWCLFQSRDTDVNVIEVGLGGRLDSTNVCHSALSIITSISFDHQQQLGHTLPLIAAEKGGIIKPNTPVIHGVRDPESRAVLRTIARESGSDLWELGVDFDCDMEIRPVSDDPQSLPSSILHFEPLKSGTALTRLRSVPLAMLGRHQVENGALAIAACQRLRNDGWSIPDEALIASLGTTQIDSRIQRLLVDPILIVDAAHNVASISALLTAIQEYYPPGPLTMIFACSKDKDVELMLAQILERADRVVLTQFHTNPRAMHVERLEAMARSLATHDPKRSHCQIFSAPDVELAMRFALDSAQKGERLCVAGSFFLAAEAKVALAQLRRSAT